MATLDTAEQVSPKWCTVAEDSISMSWMEKLIRSLALWLPSRRFLFAVIALGGMQLLATMDSTIAIVTLPKMQEELGLSDAGRSWVITAYVLTFGGLMLLGGRLGDTVGRKRAFLAGVGLFIASSTLCSLSWNAPSLVLARLLQGVGAAIASPTALALVATIFPKGPARNVATAAFGAMTAVGSVTGLVIGGALTEVSWRYAFAINIPVGLLMLIMAYNSFNETRRERIKLDVAGALLGTICCTAAVFAFSIGPEKGWISAITLGSGAVALVSLLSFIITERNALNPVVPFSLFANRNRTATFLAIFLAGGVLFTATVTIGLYVQDLMGYSALRAGISFIPFVVGLGAGLGVSSQIVRHFSPRVLVITGGIVVLGAMIYGSTVNRNIHYFPNFVTLIVLGGFGIGIIVVPLMLSAITGVSLNEIGPASAIALMLQNLGGPLVLSVIQAVISSRTLYLGGTTGPVKDMNLAQINALDAGYTYGLLWIALVSILVGGCSLLITYTAADIAHTQQVQDEFDISTL